MRHLARCTVDGWASSAPAGRSAHPPDPAGNGTSIGRRVALVRSWRASWAAWRGKAGSRRRRCYRSGDRPRRYPGRRAERHGFGQEAPVPVWAQRILRGRSPDATVEGVATLVVASGTVNNLRQRYPIITVAVGNGSSPAVASVSARHPARRDEGQRPTNVFVACPAMHCRAHPSGIGDSCEIRPAAAVFARQHRAAGRRGGTRALPCPKPRTDEGGHGSLPYERRTDCRTNQISGPAARCRCTGAGRERGPPAAASSPSAAASSRRWSWRCRSVPPRGRWRATKRA